MRPTLLALLPVLLAQLCSSGENSTSIRGHRAALHEALQERAWRRGVRFPKVEILEAAGMRGLFVRASAAAIEPGEPIVVLPGSFALLSSEVLARFEHVPPQIADMPASQLLAGRLLEELIVGRSVWAPYLRALPGLQDLVASLPFLWPRSLQSGLAGSAAYYFTHHLRRDLHSCVSRLCAGAAHWPASSRASPLLEMVFCDRALAVTACSIARTRGFDAPDDPRVGVMLPLADMANHDNSAPEFHLPSSRGGGYGGLVAQTRLEPGEQVFASYRQSSNSNLLATYGFILPRNHNDIILVPAGLLDRILNLTSCDHSADLVRVIRAAAPEGDPRGDEPVRGYLDWSGRPSVRLRQALATICRDRRRVWSACGAGAGRAAACEKQVLLLLVGLLRDRFVSLFLSLSLSRARSCLSSR